MILLRSRAICAQPAQALAAQCAVGSRGIASGFPDYLGNLVSAVQIAGLMNPTTDTLTSWQLIGGADPTTLTDARLQLHHALQVIVSAPISFLPAKPDDSHTNLEWLSNLAALGTTWLTGPKRIRFALQPAELALLAIDADGRAARYALDGHTIDEAVAWLRAAAANAGYDGAALTTKKHYEIPLHRVAAGRPFAFEPREAFAELGRYYANAHDLTSHVAAKRGGASAPRCWPHHFDLATLITLSEAPGRGPRTVGVGLSPGDDSYAQPYFYVGPYPHPPVERLQPLTLGSWHTQGWVGAVLRGSDILQVAPDRQAQTVRAFATEAIDASIATLT